MVVLASLLTRKKGGDVTVTHQTDAANDLISCEECRRHLARCIQEAVQPFQAKGLTEHLLSCEACFGFYADLTFPESEGEEGPPYIGRRPVWGPLAWGSEEEDRMVDNLLDRIDEMEETGGLIVIKYDRPCQKSALLLLIQLRARLKEEGKTVQTFLPLTQDLPLSPGLEEEGDCDCALIFEAPRFGNLIEYLETVTSKSLPRTQSGGLKGGKKPILIAHGARTDWGATEIPVNHVLLSWGSISPGEEERFREELEAEAIGDLTGAEEKGLGQAYLLVALLDFLEVPTPVALLGRLLGKGEEEIPALLAQAKGLLFPVEAEEVSLVWTKGETVAAQVVGMQWGKEEKMEVACRQIIRAALPSERHTVLKLFRGLLLRGQSRVARRLLQEEEGALQGLFEEATQAELLVWGKTLRETRYFDQARAVFEKGLKVAPDNIYLLHALADLLGRWRGHEEEAEEYFRKALEIDQQNLYILQAFGDLKRRRGRRREAEALFRDALRIDEKNVYTRVAYANLLIEEERYPEAEERLKRTLAIDSRNVQVIHSWGQLEKRRRNYARARECFEEVLRIDAHNAYALHALGQMALERGHWGEAQGRFEETLSLDMDNIFVLQALGVLWDEMGEMEAALQWFNEMHSLDPDNVEAQVARAVLESKRGNYQEAQQGFEQALNLDKENLYAVVAWGEMEIRREKFREARELLERAWRQLRESGRRGKEPPALLNVLAKLEAAESGYNLQKARRWRSWFEESLKIDQDNVITYNSWAKIEARAGELTRAEELFRKALDCDPDNAYTHREYGEMLLSVEGRQEEGQGHRLRAQKLGMEKLSANISRE